MFPAHYAVPDNLDIMLVGYVRHGWDDHGHYITTLWRNKTGQFFYFEDFWTPYTPPLWLGIALEDLTSCTPHEFCAHVDQICLPIEDTEEQASVYCRFAELMAVWGILEGVDRGFDFMRENPKL